MDFIFQPKYYNIVGVLLILPILLIGVKEMIAGTLQRLPRLVYKGWVGMFIAFIYFDATDFFNTELLASLNLIDDGILPTTVCLAGAWLHFTLIQIISSLSKDTGKYGEFFVDDIGYVMMYIVIFFHIALLWIIIHKFTTVTVNMIPDELIYYPRILPAFVISILMVPLVEVIYKAYQTKR